MDETTQEPELQQAHLLLAHGRYEHARERFAQALARDPEDPEAHHGMATCLLELDQPEAAMTHAERVLGLAPDWSGSHHLMGSVCLQLRRIGAAYRHARAALAADPDEPSNHALIAVCHVRRKQWAEAVRAADAGLRLDPDDEPCLSLRAMALSHRGDHAAAEEGVARSLELDPEDPVAHANAGWSALRRGDQPAARRHLLEALRLEPGQEWAREGLIEAIKSRNPLYRRFFRILSWFGALPAGRFVALMILSVVVRLQLRTWTDGHPAVAIPANLVIWGIFSLFIATMIVQPLTNLALFVHPLGRHALTGRERLQAGLLGLASLIPLAGIVALAHPDRLHQTAGDIALLGVLLLPPLAFASSPERLVGWSRAALIGICVGFFLLAAGYVAAAQAYGAHVETLEGMLRGVAIDGFSHLETLAERKALVTAGQNAVIERVNEQFHAGSWLRDLQDKLGLVAFLGPVAFTWFGGLVYRPR